MFHSNSSMNNWTDNIGPFWISRETVAWPWCNLVASQKRPYCVSLNSHYSVELVSRQWDASDWPCVLCDRRIQQWPSEKISESALMRLPILQLSCRRFCLAQHHITQVCQPPYSPDLVPCLFYLFPNLKSSLKVRRCVDVTVTQYTRSVNGISLPRD